MPSDVDIERLNEMAKKVLLHMTQKLIMKYRYLDLPIMKMKQKPVDGEKSRMTFGTDGKYFLYDPVYILNLFKQENKSSAVQYQYLHSLMHCLFSHPWVKYSIQERIWELSCDIAAEALISQTFGKALTQEQKEVIENLEKETETLTAERIYSTLTKNKLSTEELTRYENLFRVDDHPWWGNDQSDPSEREDGTADWKMIREKVLTEITDFLSKMYGDEAGNFVSQLGKVTAEKGKYREFLERFASKHEMMEADPDEFDLVTYSHSMTVLDKRPIIEPLEYREKKILKDLVIAIDTSGSTSGDLVKKFLAKTYGIIMDQETFDKKFHVHLIQVDTEVQHVDVITSREEFQNVIKDFKIYGCGGTDFNPAFQYVEEKKKAGEFTNLRGMIYFTDGYGPFPEKAPSFDSAFVFINKGVDCPPWAIKIVLDELEIRSDER